jgi:hypothetical protein
MEADGRMATARHLAYMERLGSDLGAAIARPMGGADCDFWVRNSKFLLTVLW